MGPRQFALEDPGRCLQEVGAGLVARALKFSSQSFDERSLHLKAALMMNVSDEI